MPVSADQIPQNFYTTPTEALLPLVVGYVVIRFKQVRTKNCISPDDKAKPQMNIINFNHRYMAK